nr:phosphoribosylanthranilate isomerase [Ktedonobacterales bacterium]
GADMIGLVFAKSTRQVTPEQAREIVRAIPSGVATVGVFADESVEAINHAVRVSGVQMVQIADSSEQVRLKRQLKRLTIVARSTANPINAVPPPFADKQRSLTLLDSATTGLWGGTGRLGDWDVAAKWAREYPIILAGGLTPNNVGEAIRAVQPWGVDVSSGIEGPDGQKDPARMRAFVEAARSAH